MLSAAPYMRSARKGVRGCQIDLLIQTERMALVVEINRRKDIGHGIIDEVKAKVDALEVSKDRSVRTALVYDGSLSPSVEADRFFDFVVDAADLLRSHVPTAPQNG